MKKTTKVLLTLACAVLLVAASVMGTLAYLTDRDAVTNTFTVGKVDIKLDEAKVGDDGKALTGDDAERVTENTYHLLPGHEYDKDPTVTVLKGSDESYVRMLATYTFDKVVHETKRVPMFNQMIRGADNRIWVGESSQIKNETGKNGQYTVVTFEYRYKETVSAKEADKKLEPLFTGIKIPDIWDNAEMETFGNFKIEVVAQAIQASGFVAADGKTAEQVAWEAFDA